VLNSEFFIGQGDTKDPIRVTVYHEYTNTPVNLAGLTVTFSMVTDLGAVIVDDQPAVIDGLTSDGKVYYEWQDGDTDIAGDFRGRFKFTDQFGKVFSAPNEGYIAVHVTKF